MALENWNDPNYRFLAALDGYELENLVNDEVWLVRHAAKRAMREQESKEKGDYISELGDIDISVMVYELYKQDWINKHTTPEMRMESVRNWCRISGMRRANGIQPDTYGDWVANEGFFGASYLEYYEFCGFLQSDNIGIYHDKRYVAELLGDDDRLLALYAADINDGVEMEQADLATRLTAAKEQSEQRESGVRDRPKSDLEII